MLTNLRIAFIGGGHISEIIIHNLTARKEVPADHIIVSDPAEPRRQYMTERYGIRIANDNIKAAQSGDLIMICVRPNIVATIMPDLQAANLHSGQVLISVAAGIPLRTYEQIGNQPQIVRALPNPPSQVGQGIAPLVFSPAVTPENRERVLALFAALGEAVTVDEAYLDAITSLSSPVATYVFFQALIEAGVGCGLPDRLAEQVAAQTISGSMSVWRSRMVSPTELIQEASTPGGVSIESVRTLDEMGFKRAVKAAIMNGASRSEALGKAA